MTKLRGSRLTPYPWTAMGAPGPRARARLTRWASGGVALHEWAFPTRDSLQRCRRRRPAPQALNADFAPAVGMFDIVPPWIMGRNIFGPIRKPGPTMPERPWVGETTPPVSRAGSSADNHPRLQRFEWTAAWEKKKRTRGWGATFHFRHGVHSCRR